MEGPNSLFPVFRASADDANGNYYCFNTIVLSKSGGPGPPCQKSGGGGAGPIHGPQLQQLGLSNLLLLYFYFLLLQVDALLLQSN